MKKKTLSKSDIKRINEQVQERYGLADLLSKKDAVFIIEDAITFLVVNDKQFFFYLGEELIPTLRLLQERLFLKTVSVDMPAVPFMIKGADCMRPGITAIDAGIKRGDIIAIIDEKHRKPVAVGRALLSSEDMQAASAGKVIKNLHYVGDAIWSALALTSGRN